MDKRVLVLVLVATSGVLGFWLASTFTSSGDVDLESQFARPKAARTPVHHSLVGEELRPIIGDYNWQKYIVDDPNKTVVADDAEFQEFLAQFQDFPLYWLGQDFQGLSLTEVIRAYHPDTTPPEDSVILLYGTCTPPPDGGCPAPLQILVEPYCYTQPGMIASEAKEATAFKLRGADAQYISEGLRMWMGEVSVRIDGHPRERIEPAAQALVSPNGLGPSSSSDPLPPANVDCSDFTLEPYLGG